MRYLLSFIFLCIIVCANAQYLKVNYKGEIRPYTIKIDKIEVKENQTIVFVEVKQQKNFSYNILLDNCTLIPNSTSQQVEGKLRTWNDSKKALEFSKPVRDDCAEKFTIMFPGTDILTSDYFDITIGTIQNRQKTPITIQNVAIKKK